MSMFNFEALQVLEKTISSAVNLCASTFKSIFLLITKPIIAPRLLQRRFNSDSEIQIGPLTLTFILFNLFLIVSDYGDNSSVFRDFSKIFQETGQSTLISIVFASLLGSSMVDLYARVTSRSKSLKLSNKSLGYLATKNTDARNRISYSISPIILSVAIFFYINLYSLPDYGRYLSLGLPILASFLFTNTFYQRRYFPAKVRSPKRTHRFKAFLCMNVCILSIIVCVVFIESNIRSAYPDGETIKIASTEDLKLYDRSCIALNDKAIVSAKIFNKSKGPALVKLPLNIELMTKDYKTIYRPTAEGLSEKDNERIIDSGRMLSVTIRYNITSIAPSGIAVCTVDMPVMSRSDYKNVTLAHDNW
ncbi:hypothetical protein [Methylobacterium sp. Leaf93]|uniref:hypothetical protein n=1 Tax=Methylobacterium sp. Leaf93 TaxID=1736249 RepID=UPI000B162FA0|nr:hypothetical protein [Methylobacterium sp. Leaf93]